MGPVCSSQREIKSNQPKILTNVDNQIAKLKEKVKELENEISDRKQKIEESHDLGNYKQSKNDDLQLSKLLSDKQEIQLFIKLLENDGGLLKKLIQKEQIQSVMKPLQNEIIKKLVSLKEGSKDTIQNQKTIEIQKQLDSSNLLSCERLIQYSETTFLQQLSTKANSLNSKKSISSFQGEQDHKEIQTSYFEEKSEFKTEDDLDYLREEIQGKDRQTEFLHQIIDDLIINQTNLKESLQITKQELEKKEKLQSQIMVMMQKQFQDQKLNFEKLKTKYKKKVGDLRSHIKSSNDSNAQASNEADQLKVLLKQKNEQLSEINEINMQIQNQQQAKEQQFKKEIQVLEDQIQAQKTQISQIIQQSELKQQQWMKEIEDLQNKNLKLQNDQTQQDLIEDELYNSIILNRTLQFSQSSIPMDQVQSGENQYIQELEQQILDLEIKVNQQKGLKDLAVLRNKAVLQQLEESQETVEKLKNKLFEPCFASKLKIVNQETEIYQLKSEVERLTQSCIYAENHLSLFQNSGNSHTKGNFKEEQNKFIEFQATIEKKNDEIKNLKSILMEKEHQIMELENQKNQSIQELQNIIQNQTKLIQEELLNRQKDNQTSDKSRKQIFSSQQDYNYPGYFIKKLQQ